MPIRQVDVEPGWEPAKLSGTWEPDSAERDAVGMLNAVPQPARSHPEPQRWEASRREDHSVVEHEAGWARSAELRAEREALRRLLLRYVETLATVRKAPALINATREVLTSLKPVPDSAPR